ncbi:MAG TPA: alpha/beta fold hydrolase [Allosphingosinicella sp.]|nr:alpha/beta fold hydrolase [Allosphingosinicella sp.]
MRALRFLLVLVGATGLLLLALPFAAPWFIFRPQPMESVDPRPWEVPAEAVAIAAADGSRLAGWWLSPPDPRAPVVLVMHGRSGNIATRAAIVRRLAADGFGVLAFDYRGYGASSGRPGERAMSEDALSAYDWLRARRVAPGRIVVLGQSLGNAPAARLASARPIGGLILTSPFISLPEAAADRYPSLPIGMLPWPRNRFEVAAHLRRLAAPVLLVVARRDPLVPFAHARRFAESLPRPPQWIIDERHGHDGLLTAVIAEGRVQAFVRSISSGDSRPPPPRSLP